MPPNANGQVNPLNPGVVGSPGYEAAGWGSANWQDFQNPTTGANSIFDWTGGPSGLPFSVPNSSPGPSASPTVNGGQDANIVGTVTGNDAAHNGGSGSGSGAWGNGQYGTGNTAYGNDVPGYRPTGNELNMNRGWALGTVPWLEEPSIINYVGSDGQAHAQAAMARNWENGPHVHSGLGPTPATPLPPKSWGSQGPEAPIPMLPGMGGGGGTFPIGATPSTPSTIPHFSSSPFTADGAAASPVGNAMWMNFLSIFGIRAQDDGSWGWQGNY